jgi:hypothetical protein
MRERCCGTCRWRLLRDCQYPLPEWAGFLLHKLYYEHARDQRMYPTTMNDSDGQDCPTWEVRP